MSTSAHQFVATAANFMQDVVEASAHTPVLVDFWAPWCAPCRQLMPVLERLVGEYGGALRLAKVNTEEEQAIAAQLGIRSLPTVVLFKDRAPVDHFMGALPEAEIRKMLDRHLPRPQQDPLTEVRALKSKGALAEARTLLEGLLASQPESVEIGAELGEVHALAGDLDAARTQLDTLKAREPQHSATHRLEAVITFRDTVAAHPDPGALIARVADAPHDAEARHALAVHRLLSGRYEPALAEWLALMKEQPAFGDGLARRSLVQAFELIGANDPLVMTTRREMAKLLF